MNDATFAPGVDVQKGTTADLIDQVKPGKLYATGTSVHAIVENGGLTPATLTVNQVTNSAWNVLIRDGVRTSGAPAGALTVVKTGPGIAEVQNTNYYTGGTQVNGGILQVENPFGADVNTGNGSSALGSGLVTVGSAGTLRGTGYIGASVSVSGTPGRVGSQPGVAASAEHSPSVRIPSETPSLARSLPS